MDSDSAAVENTSAHESTEESMDFQSSDFSDSGDVGIFVFLQCGVCSFSLIWKYCFQKKPLNGPQQQGAHTGSEMDTSSVGFFYLYFTLCILFLVIPRESKKSFRKKILLKHRQ